MTRIQTGGDRLPGTNDERMARLLQDVQQSEFGELFDAELATLWGITLKQASIVITEFERKYHGSTRYVRVVGLPRVQARDARRSRGA